MEYPEYPGKTVAVGAPCLHLTLVTSDWCGANAGITRLLRFIASVTPGGTAAVQSTRP